jgi:hypothetical protein
MGFFVCLVHDLEHGVDFDWLVEDIVLPNLDRFFPVDQVQQFFDILSPHYIKYTILEPMLTHQPSVFENRTKASQSIRRHSFYRHPPSSKLFSKAKSVLTVIQEMQNQSSEVVLQFVHVVQHLGCEVLLLSLAFRVCANLRFHAIGVFSGDDSFGWRLFEGFGSARVELLLVVLIVHPAIVDIVFVLDAVPGVLPDVVVIFFGLETDDVVGLGLLVVHTHLVQLQTPLAIIRQLRILWPRHAFGHRLREL